MTARFKTSLMLIPLSIALLSFARIWQTVSRFTDVPQLVESLWHAPKQASIDAYDCRQNYTIEILSIDPLMIYINNFLSDYEVNHILDVGLTIISTFSRDKFEQSPVYDENLKTVVDRRFRTSQSAMVPKSDVVGKCLSRKMKSILGNIQHIDTEPIQIVKYEPNERFRIHMDWFDKPRNRTYSRNHPRRSYNRLASIFAYLDDSCTGGETYFPEVQGVSNVADGDKFSRTESGKGLLVRPKRGNAVFWNNLLPNGTGDPRVAHAGLPVHSGRKIGINLFSHYYYDAPMLGGDEE
ncbi:2OG-Fe(II) oxygenase family Oxidoreductase [Fusarium beomiforme]|uniref:2OG-Fe(II) oxygenase family Oxidoreductase n=1 Tax=Fusarium beomiforme TaxID=44412 RepID=A0A9P5A8V4_9HYPO|nr:2OG-Fe(II) oxygenase family Oxidoreductase [Fusarium beomiforme]